MGPLSNYRQTVNSCSVCWPAAMALIFLVPIWPLVSQEPSRSQNLQLGDAGAEPEAAVGDESDIRVRVDVVNVPVAALNSEGLPVYGLKKSDFEVYEDGKRQEITHFRRETDIPLRVGLLLDTSNSARRYLEFEKDAASEFAYVLLQKSRKHQIFLLTFDGAAEVVVDFSNDRDKLEEAILDLKAGGGKALFDSIYFACKEKMVRADNPNGTRRVLVIVSDGIDSQSTRSLEEVISMANSTRYGLSASLFTSDVSRAHRVAAAIDSGIVWVNTWMLRDLRIPFGGMKSSGVGREGGFNSLEFFTEPKNVCVKL